MLDFNPNQNHISTHKRSPIARQPQEAKMPPPAVPPLAVPLDAKDTWIAADITQKAGTVGAFLSSPGSQFIHGKNNDPWGQLGGSEVTDAEEVVAGGLVPNPNGKLLIKFSPVSRRECAAVLKSMSFGTDSLCHADAARLAMMVHDIPSPASLV